MLSKNRTKFLKSLHLKKFRDETGLFLVEGEKSVLEVLKNKKDAIDSVYSTNPELILTFQHEGIEAELIDSKELQAISTLKNPSSSLLVCKKWKSGTGDFRFVLALDNIQDPGNLGTLIRLSDWYGVDAIVCSSNTVEMYNPKVIQASMGSFFRIPIFYRNLGEFLQESKLPIYGALLEGKNIYTEKLDAQGILILGNEGNGISEEIKTLIQHPVTIPKKGETESLNVATAGAILLSEFFRGSF